MQAIDLIKSDVNEKALSVSSDFYRHFERNNNAFDDMLSMEEAVSSDRVILSGNDAKIVRLLKAMKAEPRFTDDQEMKIDKLIFLWEQGEIPSKISKEVVKKSKHVDNVLELYFEIMKLVPDTYFEEKKNQKLIIDGEKQIVLSCYLEKEG